MRKMILLVIAFFTLSNVNAQSSNNEVAFNKIYSTARPSIKQWVTTTAAKYKSGNISEGTARAEATQAARSLGNFNNQDIEALAFLVLMQAAKSANEDLKSVMADVKSINAAKAKQRQQLSQSQKAAANKVDSPKKLVLSNDAIQKLQMSKDQLSETSEADQLKLQMYMDRMTKADQAASNVLKKFSDVMNQIIGNMK